MWTVVRMITVSYRKKKYIYFVFISQCLVKIPHLLFSEFLDLYLSFLNAVLFSLHCKALWPLVNECNVSAGILLLEEVVVVRKEKLIICSMTYWWGNWALSEGWAKNKVESGGKGEIPDTVGTEMRDGGSRWLAVDRSSWFWDRHS